MNQDILPKFQEEGSYRFALNAVLETELGQIPSISNELSNTSCSLDVPTSKILIGSALTDTDTSVLFYYDPAGDHEIGLFNPVNCTYTQVLHGTCLNFSENYPINAIVKIRNGCDRVVYFTDNYNRYRVLNLDNVDSVLHPDTGALQCEKLLYTKDFFKPCVFAYRGVQNSGVEDNAGGNLEIGVYYFAVRFLDAELNTTEWTLITRGVAIADEPTADLFNAGMVNLYDGGSNTETSPHYVPKTDKAISLVITGQDDLFPMYQVAVIKRTSDSGALTGVDILKPKPFQGFFGGGALQVPFIYNGNPADIEREGSIQEILVGRQPIDKVAAHAIKDDRNFLGGVSYDYRDYSLYQQYATKIKTEWIKTSVIYSIQGTPRKPDYYLLNGSFMEDEVYAVGIVYVFSNGRTSPVFHIPGRAADTNIPGTAFNPLIGTGGVPTSGGAAWDTGLEAYGGFVPGIVSANRWKSISTAYSYTSAFPLSGMMGFYECDTETYPAIETCTDLPDGYWGRDFAGNLIEAGITKIRHHRMPGAEFKDTASLAENFRTGFQFSNVEYPPDQDIVGHYFVYGDRSYDKTIQAKGIFIPLSTYFFDTEDFLPKNYTVPVTPGSSLSDFNYLFVSAQSLLQEKFTQGDYVKIEKVLRDVNYELGGLSAIQKSNTSSIVTDVPSGDNVASTNNTTIRYFTKYGIPEKGEIISTILSSIKVDKTYTGALVGTESYEPISNKELVNQSVNHSYQFLHLNRTISGSITTNGGNWEGKAYFGSIRQTRKVFTNLFSIQYKRMSNCVDVAINTARKFIQYGGDTAINRVSFVEFDYAQTGVTPAPITLETNAVYFSFPSQDSWVNYEFRHGSSTEAKDEYFKYRQAGMVKDHLLFSQYLDRKKYEIDEAVIALYPETYNYNNSYSFLDGIEINYPLPFAYQYCNLCVNDHPYRIYASESDTQETLEDKSRIVLPNNYKDLNGLSGEITDLFVNFDNLYTTTANSTYLVPTNTQVFQTDLNDVYLGTGQVLSIAPRELKNTSYAFGGQQYFKSRVNTEYGTFFVDALSKRPLLLTNNLEDISLSGMRNFWQDNGEVFFVNQFFRLTGTEYPYKSTSATAGIGYISTYDPRYKRIIVHKRDFMLNPSWESHFVYYPQETDDPNSGFLTPKKVWYNGFNFYYNDTTNPPQLITLENTDFFENKSFTLSYSFLSKYWTSFHSYLPKYMFNSSNTFFTTDEDVVGDNYIYKHNDLGHQNFYGVYYPHIIDTIFKYNPMEQKTASAVVFNSRAYERDFATNSWKNIPKTYTNFIGYNTNQSTGLQSLVIKDDAFQFDDVSNISLIKLTDTQWRLNNIRDLVVDNSLPIWDSS